MEDWIISVNIALVIITLIYVIFTFRIAKSNEKSVELMKEQTESYYRPYISVTHRMNSKAIVELIIENIGITSAKELRLDIDKHFYQLNKNNENLNLKNLPPFNNTIENFPPKGKIVYALLHGSVLHEAQDKYPETPFVFTINATYSYLDKVINETNVLDLRTYIYTAIYKEPLESSLESIRDELKEIRKIISKDNNNKTGA